MSRSRRDYCLFTLGINTAYRASELLSLTVGQVRALRTGDLLDIKQSKTAKYRAATLNRNAASALRLWLAEHPFAHDPGAALFPSRRGHGALSVPALSRLVKRWCAEAGLHGHYASHTLRKSWGYHQRKRNRAPMPLLMTAFGHSTEAQTLTYLHIQERELRDLFLGMPL